MVQTKIRRYLKHGTLPQLSVFEAVARLGSFTKAAEELYMAQPTVSVQMKKLSETVGLPLIEQIGKGIYLTEAGRVLQASCHDVFSTLASSLSVKTGQSQAIKRIRPWVSRPITVRRERSSSASSSESTPPG